MKTIQILLAVVLLPSGTLTLLPSCSTTGGYVQSAQAWLTDPKNQQLIQDIAGTAIHIIGAFGDKPAATTRATVVSQLAAKYPDVPAGALKAIATRPHDYKKGP